MIESNVPPEDIISGRCGSSCFLRVVAAREFQGYSSRGDRARRFSTSSGIDLPVASWVQLTTDKSRGCAAGREIISQNNRTTAPPRRRWDRWNRKNVARSRLIGKVAHLLRVYGDAALTISLSLSIFLPPDMQWPNISRLRRSNGERIRSHDAVSAHRARHARHAESVQAWNTSLTCTDLISHG